MSKLTDILDRFRLEQEMRSRRTVAEFANELNKDVALILKQFAEAGIVFSGADDEVLEVHKSKLLSWLKSQHPSQRKKKITIVKNPDFSPYGRAWRAVSADENGAEWDCLNEFAAAVVFGEPIHPDHQRLVNLVVAKAVIQGALPLRRVGRPVETRTNELAMKVAMAYWDLLDSGSSSSEVVEYLSAKFHKTERQIFRYVQANRKSFKESKDARDKERRLFELMASLGNPKKVDWVSPYELPTPDLTSMTDQDYLDHLHELIAKEAVAFPDVKDLKLIDSDKGE
jgi:acetoin utilization deacetylase AcuC-like enzyme